MSSPRDAPDMSGPPTIDVQYTCHGCGLRDRVVAGVTERTLGEDLMQWLGYVRTQVSLDHATTSPSCRSGKCDLKLPINHAGRVGEAVRQ